MNKGVKPKVWHNPSQSVCKVKQLPRCFSPSSRLFNVSAVHFASSLALKTHPQIYLFPIRLPLCAAGSTLMPVYFHLPNELLPIDLWRSEPLHYTKYLAQIILTNCEKSLPLSHGRWWTACWQWWWFQKEKQIRGEEKIRGELGKRKGGKLLKAIREREVGAWRRHIDRPGVRLTPEDKT